MFPRFLFIYFYYFFCCYQILALPNGRHVVDMPTIPECLSGNKYSDDSPDISLWSLSLPGPQVHLVTSSACALGPDVKEAGEDLRGARAAGAQPLTRSLSRDRVPQSGWAATVARVLNEKTSYKLCQHPWGSCHRTCIQLASGTC